MAPHKCFMKNMYTSMKDLRPRKKSNVFAHCSINKVGTLHAIFHYTLCDNAVGSPTCDNRVGCKLDAFGDPKSFSAAVVRSERASH